VILAQVDRLVKTYHVGNVPVRALRGVDLSIRRGEFLAIMGHSGSGKSTLLNILGCLDRPTAGTYILGEQDVSRLTDDQLSEIRARRIGFVFQQFNLIPQLTVLENLEVPLYYLGVARRTRRQRAERIAGQMGLADRVHHRPMELSGGQQQRVAVGRSLVNSPLMLLADEPTGNLDSTTSESILDILEELHEQQGMTIIMVTHEQHVAARSGRIVHIHDGVIVNGEQAAAAPAGDKEQNAADGSTP
jgi:putative ABC transport system ATP-binding protein